MQDMHCNASTSKAWKYRSAAFVKKPCIDFKKFIEKAVDHWDVGYHNEATTAVKNFVKSMEKWPKCVCELEDSICYTNERKQKHNYLYC